VSSGWHVTRAIIPAVLEANNPGHGDASLVLAMYSNTRLTGLTARGNADQHFTVHFKADEDSAPRVRRNGTGRAD